MLVSHIGCTPGIPLKTRTDTPAEGPAASAYARCSQNLSTKATDSKAGIHSMDLLERGQLWLFNEEDMSYLLDKSKKLVNEHFSEAGISTAGPIDLYSDSEGRLRVRGQHPDKERIEELFSSDPELSETVRNTLICAENLASMAERMEFQKAYARDPRAAVARYSYLFNSDDNQKSHFFTRLQPQNGGWTISELPEEQYRFRFRGYSSDLTRQSSMDRFWLEWRGDRDTPGTEPEC